MKSQCVFSPVKAGFSSPLGEKGCVWSLSSLESVGALGRVVSGCVGVSVPSSHGFLCGNDTASHSGDACSLGTWQREEQTVTTR